MKSAALAVCVVLGCGLAGCTEGPLETEQLLAELDAHVGKRVVVRAVFRSGARCRLETPDGKWKTYCRNCQFCRGPVVIASPNLPEDVDVDDWPLILGGTWRGRDIRCTGPLNKVECYPFELGKSYIVRGRIEDQRPRKLLVSGLST